MVIESFISPFKAEKNPYELMFFGFFYSSISILLSMWIFQEYSSLLMVFLTVMACMPLMYNIMKSEEIKDTIFKSELKLLKEHGKAVEFLMFLFFGITIGYVFWYVLLPNYFQLGNFFFKVQKETLFAINGRITNSVVRNDIFVKILLNNIKVLIFCILFSFLFGLGAIFILTWNSSVIATATGDFINNGLKEISKTTVNSITGGYFSVVMAGFLRYMIHGIPEIAAYFVGGLAGGIISFAIAKHHFKTKKFENILLDSSELIVIAILILVVAGLLEVFVTPIFFS
tara:strand:- start:29487 stop:30344 length:858 start_codon:yes stop_codon:yes gene_type:complete